jgi:hypothetical protein
LIIFPGERSSDERFRGDHFPAIIFQAHSRISSSRALARNGESLQFLRPQSLMDHSPNP